MTSERRASFLRGPGVATVTVRPRAGATVRALEAALRAGGVSAVVAWEKKQVYLPATEFTRAREALQGWGLDVAADMLEEAEAMSRQVANALLGKRVVEEVAKPGVAEEMLRDFPERCHLDQHQREAVAAIAHPDVSGMCLFDEQGLGKTVTTLFAYHRLRGLGEVTRMLIISPKSMLFEWVRETERFFRYRAQAVVGLEREKRESLNRPADIYVTNFETAINLDVRLRELLESERGRAFLVVDESYFVKNAEAHRTLAIRRLRRSVRRCLVLCGTPAPNSPHDLVEQFNIADGGVAFHEVRIPPERDAARPIVRQVIADRGVYMRRLKQDVLPDLPGKTFHRVLVPLQPQQERIYSAALQQLVTDLEATDDVTFKKQVASFIARRIALLQICSNPVSVVTGYRETPAKLIALDNILDELVAQRGEKVIIWSFFTASLDGVYDRFQRFNPVRFDGQVPDPVVRREVIQRFQEDDDTMLFVGNPAAAGAGLTLHRARYAVYESLSNQAAHYLQSLDRIHRRGQERAVEYLVLLCDRTVELAEYDRLMEKERAAQQLLGDEVEPPITREALLREAKDAARLLGLPQGF